jgi:hypothetical protein
MDSLYHGLNHCIHLVPSCFFFFCSQSLLSQNKLQQSSVKSCCLCSLSLREVQLLIATFFPFLFLLGLIQVSAPQTDVVVAVDSRISRVCSWLEARCFRTSLDVAAVDSPVPTVCSLPEASCFRFRLDVAAVDSPVPTVGSLPEASFFRRDVVALDSRIYRVCCSPESSSSRGDVCRGFLCF